MIQRAIALQNEGEAFYFIANYHALTSVRDPEALRANCRGVAVDFLACGFDPERGMLFHAKRCPAGDRAMLDPLHRRANGIARTRAFLQGQTRARATSFGRFIHLPVLQAADILIYDSDLVPVGKDQKQHIEIARDLAVKINETYGQSSSCPKRAFTPRPRPFRASTARR